VTVNVSRRETLYRFSLARPLIAPRAATTTASSRVARTHVNDAGMSLRMTINDGGGQP
jgi:hypothetical protein